MHLTPFSSFLHAHTQIATPDLCPEIRLHLTSNLEAIWESQETWFARLGLSPPFWSIAWVGGQALARFTLDNPSVVRNRSVLDVGSGSGLCAIAAAMAGARTVDAADIDRFSGDVIGINARLNDVRVESLQEDVIGVESQWDVVLAGDLWYEGFLAERLTGWLRRIAREGTVVLLGDCGRAHFPRRGVTELQRYAIPTSVSLERNAMTSAGVWTIQ